MTKMRKCPPRSGSTMSRRRRPMPRSRRQGKRAADLRPMQVPGGSGSRKCADPQGAMFALVGPNNRSRHPSSRDALRQPIQRDSSMRRHARCAPSPFWGEGWGEGLRWIARATSTNPTLSPKGRGAHERAVRIDESL